MLRRAVLRCAAACAVLRCAVLQQYHPPIKRTLLTTLHACQRFACPLQLVQPLSSSSKPAAFAPPPPPQPAAFAAAPQPQRPALTAPTALAAAPCSTFRALDRKPATTVEAAQPEAAQPKAA